MSYTSPRRKMRALDEHGFTFVELLVVCAIIGVLSAIAFTSFAMYKDNAEFAKAQATMGNARIALEAGFETISDLGWVDGWSGAHGEPLGGDIALMLPEMAVPDRVKLHVSHMNCGWGSRSMDMIFVYACSPGLAQWYFRNCGGMDFMGPKFFVGRNFC